MTLDLEIARTTGRARREVVASIARELTVEDLAALGQEKGVKPTALKRLSERHHALARLLAAGKPPGEAAAILNYDPSRVSILQADPTFRELMLFYKEEVIEPTYRDFHSKLSSLAEDAVDLLADRLADDPDSISTAMALEITKTAADRTGFGPSSQTTQVNVNVNLADRLKVARDRAREAMSGPLIDG